MAIDNVNSGTPILATWGNSVADELNRLNVRSGDWTPGLDFATTGNLSVAYSSRSGIYLRIEDVVFFRFLLVTSVFTHSTASGSLRVTGLPFPVASSVNGFAGAEMQGWTKANYTFISFRPEGGTSRLIAGASGSGQSLTGLMAADMPSGGTVQIRSGGTYWATVGS